MKARIYTLFVLIMSLVLVSNASGATAKRATATISSHTMKSGEATATQQPAENVQLVGQIGGPTLRSRCKGAMLIWAWARGWWCWM